MNILFQSRSNLENKWGGDTTQILNTAASLRQLGVNVEIEHRLLRDYKEFDLVHVFNMQTVDSSFNQIQSAKNNSAKIVFSPIMWEKKHIISNRNIYLYHAKMLVRIIERCFPGLIGFYLSRLSIGRWRSYQKCLLMLKNCDLLLPNSIAELEVVVNMFSYPKIRAKSSIVYNAAVKSDSKIVAPAIDSVSFPSNGFVLQVGRMEPVKGQMQTLRSIYRDLQIPIVFVGGGQDSYYALQVKKLAAERGNVFFYDNVKLESIGWFYQRARVHVLPSLRESPGLATLEAISHGVPCVVSHHAPTTEYFGESVLVCDPHDLDDLRSKILFAWSGGFSPMTKLPTSFTWADAAKATLMGYQRVCSSKLILG
jgi:glycosyltransferase involved in cell wall biosynthesis